MSIIHTQYALYPSLTRLSTDFPNFHTLLQRVYTHDTLSVEHVSCGYHFCLQQLAE